MLLLQNARLQTFGSIAVLNINRSLRDNSATVGNFVNEMHGTARNLRYLRRYLLKTIIPIWKRFTANLRIF